MNDDITILIAIGCLIFLSIIWRIAFNKLNKKGDEE